MFGCAKFLRFFFCLFILALFSNELLSAEDAPAGDLGAANEPSSVNTTEDSSSAEAEEKAEEPQDDDFIPTAQISEDLSVSFPVDI